MRSNLRPDRSGCDSEKLKIENRFLHNANSIMASPQMYPAYTARIRGAALLPRGKARTQRLAELGSFRFVPSARARQISTIAQGTKKKLFPVRAIGQNECGFERSLHDKPSRFHVKVKFAVLGDASYCFFRHLRG